MNVRPRGGRRLAKRTIITVLCLAASGIVFGLDATPAAAEPPEGSAVNCARELFLFQYWDEKAFLASQFMFSDATIAHYRQVAQTHFMRYALNC